MSTPNARSDIAMIKIAIKQLGISDDDGNDATGALSTYREMLKNLTGKTSCSEASMSHAERAKVIRHLKAKGFRSKPRRKHSKAAGMASTGQVGLIYVMWKALGDEGHLQAPGTESLNAWLLNFTQELNHGAGYNAPDFLPAEVAEKVIEALKSWCRRVHIKDW